MTKEELLAGLALTDIPQTIREQIVAGAQTVAELQQAVTERDTLVSELQTTIAEYRRVQFDASIDARIAELTNWNVTGDAAKAKLDAFRRTLRGRIVAELGEERGAEQVAETVNTVWADLQPIAETVRDALAGPPAIVGGKAAGREAWKDELVANAGKMRAERGI